MGLIEMMEAAMHSQVVLVQYIKDNECAVCPSPTDCTYCPWMDCMVAANESIASISNILGTD